MGAGLEANEMAARLRELIGKPSDSNYTKWEKGTDHVHYDADVLWAVSEITGCSIAWLAGESEMMGATGRELERELGSAVRLLRTLVEGGPVEETQATLSLSRSRSKRRQ